MTLQEALNNIHNVLMTVPMTIPQGKVIIESLQLVVDKCKENISEKEKDNGHTKTFI
jgi:hypothetical protein